MVGPGVPADALSFSAGRANVLWVLASNYNVELVVSSKASGALEVVWGAASKKK